MLNCIKDSFKLTNTYIILATPLILFSLFSGLYILLSTGGNLLSLMFALVLFVLMLTAFLAGWSEMLRKCVSEPEIENTNLLIQDFPTGVGIYFLPFLGAIINIFILSLITFTITYFIGNKFIGNIGISANDISTAFASSSALKTFLMSLTKEQLIKLNLWNLIIFVGMSIEYFLLMFYIPALTFKNKNPFIALYCSIKDLLSAHFFKNVLVYILIFSTYCFISVLTTIAGINLITHFCLTLINFYYMVFVAVFVFNYYYKNYVQIGGKIDTSV